MSERECEHRLESKREQASVSEGSRSRSWAVNVVGYLLLVQTLWFVFLSFTHFLKKIQPEKRLHPFALWLATHFALAVDNNLLLWVFFAALAVLGGLATVGFFRVRRSAWGIAIALQCLNLMTALVLYFTEKPFYVYVMMIYGVILVLYLNYSEVEASFFSLQDRPWSGRSR